MNDTDTDLRTENGAMQRRQFTDKEITLLKRTICQGATDEELSLFIQQCKQYGLDPFTGQIHAVKRWDSSAGRKVMSVQVGIDGFRLIADRTGKWQGTVGPYWCGPDGDWTDVWLADEYPAAAKVGVLRSDFAEPRWGIAKWDAYVATKKNGDPNYMWDKMPAHMLAKCAEALAHRGAFPNDLSGLYTNEEMQQAGGDVQQYDGPRPDEVDDIEDVEGEIVDDDPDAGRKPHHYDQGRTDFRAHMDDNPSDDGHSDQWYESNLQLIRDRLSEGAPPQAVRDAAGNWPKAEPLAQWPEQYQEAADALLRQASEQ